MNGVMFPRHVFYLLYFFNLWGLCTEPSELRTSRWKLEGWTIFILCFYSVYLCFVCGLTYTTLTNMHANIDLLNRTNEIIIYAGAIIAYFIVIFESYCKRNIQRKFWKIFRQIGTNLNGSKRDVKFGSYFAKFVLFFVAVIAILYQQLTGWLLGLNGHHLLFLIAYISLLTMQQIRVFHYLFFVHLLNHQLNEVEIEMKNIAKSSENGTIQRESLRSIRMHYDLVHALSNCINEFFGWSNVTSILYLFLLFAVDMNWAYWLVHTTTEIAVQGT